jgi:glycosyltransferase involved in cell wall biosynthesis
MRVALVHEYFCNLGGADAAMRVLHSLFPDAPVFTLLVYDRNRGHEWLRGMDLRTSFLQRLPLAGRTHQIYLPLMPYAIEQFDFSGYDLIVSSSSFVAKGLIAPPGVPHVSYTHTRQRVAWDLESEYVSALPRPLRILASAYMHQLRQWDVTAARRVDGFIANSNFVAGRLKQLYGREATVIPPPVDVDFFVPNGEPRGEGYVAIGRLVKYKRFDLVIEACRLAGRTLRVIGDGPERKTLEAMGGGGVEFLGMRSHAEVRVELGRARGLVLGGLEDFGTVLVEAQAMGCPVIAYGKGGGPDAVQDGVTGALFDEPTAESICAAMRRAEGLRFDQEVLRAHALEFSTENFKRRVMQAIAGYVK